MKPRSKRFIPSSIVERLVPILLILLLFGLAATLGVIFLSILGLTPAF